MNASRYTEIEELLIQANSKVSFGNTRVKYFERPNEQFTIFALHIEDLYRKLELAHQRISELEKNEK